MSERERDRLTQNPSGYQPPSPYDDPTVTLLPDTAVNETHWTLSATCSGCTSWSGGAIDPLAPAPLAWAYAGAAPAAPADPDSGFGKHDQTGVVNFDFSTAGSAGFAGAQPAGGV